MNKMRYGRVLLATSMLGGLLLMSGQSASAHGYVETPAARGYQGKLDLSTLGWTEAVNLYGNVVTNPQSLEAPKGFPQKGPVDGRIASANGGFGQIGDFVLDNQTDTRWKKTDITTGENNFNWFYTAKHRTSKWHYYMTKAGWNQNSPLSREAFELIGTVNHDGSMPRDGDIHTINVPSDRMGYHVILAVWDVADTANGFYNVIDVNVKNDTGLPVMPTAPKNIKSTNITKQSIALQWDGQTTASKYHIYRDGINIATTNTNRFEDTDLSPNTNYRYQIEAISTTGQVSPKSDPFTVKTLADTAIEKPTAPKHLHSMGETTDSVSLMWGAATHTAGIKHYEIYRNGTFINRTNKTIYDDINLKANTSYSYKIRAISNDDTISDDSNILTIRTKAEEQLIPEETEKPETPEIPEVPTDMKEFKLGTFSNPILYTKNEEVQYKGKVYVTLTTHQNYGDHNWAPDMAHSLFKLK